MKQQIQKKNNERENDNVSLWKRKIIESDPFHCDKIHFGT